jgi:hypothetical protein
LIRVGCISDICDRNYFEVDGLQASIYNSLSKQEYFSDKMQALDAIVVFVSLIFLVTELTIKDENFSTISKVLRGFFRFFRLLLVFRKLTLYSNKKTSSKYEIKTPVEKIIEIISKTKLAVDDNNL